MNQELYLHNTLTRKKELFSPLNAPYVGLYVCGPTVYSDVHLGNCRTFTMFDILYRYLTFVGYKVRYVRNITDVGHLVGDGDEGEDKIGKKAKLENLEPMEIVQRYTNGFRDVMRQLNNLPPSIEPTATGHIVEQIEMTQKILDNGFAYESNGSVYFDVQTYHQQHPYGQLSGRVLDELMAGQRDLDGQDEKRNREDFALWKKASPEHIMRWNSPWGAGFPGWHIECSVMSQKYLGMQFDIHGGGMDLKFPHHECEIAQSVGAFGQDPVRYWMHANMLTINGQKMSKSLNNSILPAELFGGTHPLLSQPFGPMVLRFFMLQTHYRSTMDITEDALKAAAKGYRRLINGLRIARQLANVSSFEAEGFSPDPKHIQDIQKAVQTMYSGMNDDLNTAVALTGLYELLKKINLLHNGSIRPAQIGQEAFELLIQTYTDFVEKVFGLLEERPDRFEALVETLLQGYREAKAAKDYARVDVFRAEFKQLGLTIKDMKDRVEWAYDEQ